MIIKFPEACSEPSKHERWSFLGKTFIGFQLVTIFTKNPILDVRLGSECTFDLSFLSKMVTCGITSSFTLILKVASALPTYFTCIKYIPSNKSSVIRQKGESQNGCFKKTKHVKFSEKTNISNPLIRTPTCAYQGVRNFRFFGKTFWDSPFCLITDDIRYPLLQFQSWKKEVNFFLVTSTGRCSFYLIATQCVPSALASSTLSHFSLFNLSHLHFIFAYSLLPVSSPRYDICLKHIKCVFKWRT